MEPARPASPRGGSDKVDVQPAFGFLPPRRLPDPVQVTIRDVRALEMEPAPRTSPRGDASEGNVRHTTGPPATTLFALPKPNSENSLERPRLQEVVTPEPHSLP